MKNPKIIDWRLPSEKPIQGSWVIIETLDGDYIEDYIGYDETFDTWNESVIRWGYSHPILKKKEKEDDDFSNKMNPPKDDEKEEENDKKFREDIVDAIFYGSLLWFLLSGDSDSNAKCRERCCDGSNDSQDDKMDGNRPRFFNYFKENENKRACDEKDSSKSESVSDHTPYSPEMHKRKSYTRLRNAIYYSKAGKIGADGSWFTRRDAIKRVLECAPELEEIARDLDPWYFID